MSREVPVVRFDADRCDTVAQRRRRTIAKGEHEGGTSGVLRYYAGDGGYSSHRLSGEGTAGREIGRW